MAKYFTIIELCRSSTAVAKKISNFPNASIQKALNLLMDNVLDPVRIMWGKPINVNSGYRSEALNNAVGGAKTSQHLTGQAADITTGTKEGNKKLFDMISSSDIPFDQLIDESGYSWIHISFSEKHRKQILHL